MIERPGAEHRRAVPHQRRRRMALVKSRRSCGHDHLAFLLSRKVDQRQVRLLFRPDQRGQAEQGGEQGAHHHSVR